MAKDKKKRKYNNENSEYNSSRKNTPEKPDIEMHNNDNVRGSKVAVFFLTILAVLVCSITVITFDRTNSMYNDVTQAKEELATLEAENVRMRSELDAKISLKNVEDYAENVLGMKKIDNSQIQYIRIQNSDVISFPDAEDNIWGKIVDFFEKCVEYLKG